MDEDEGCESVEGDLESFLGLRKRELAVGLLFCLFLPWFCLEVVWLFLFSSEPREEAELEEFSTEVFGVDDWFDLKKCEFAGRVFWDSLVELIFEVDVEFLDDADSFCFEVEVVFFDSSLDWITVSFDEDELDLFVVCPEVLVFSFDKEACGDGFSSLAEIDEDELFFCILEEEDLLLVSLRLDSVFSFPLMDSSFCFCVSTEAALVLFWDEADDCSFSFWLRLFDNKGVDVASSFLLEE